MCIYIYIYIYIHVFIVREEGRIKFYWNPLQQGHRNPLQQGVRNTI